MRILRGKIRRGVIGKLLTILFLALAFVAGATTLARAADWNVMIGSSSTNGNWLGGNPDVWVPNASGSTVAASEIESRLAAGTSVTIRTSASLGTETGDITVDNDISWSTSATLSLNATWSVAVNAVITASGSSVLAVTDGTGFSVTGRVDFPGRSGTGIFSVNGANYTVIDSLGAQGSTTGTDLQGMGTSGFYALGANIDASATSAWNGSAGFVPVGTSSTPFNATFDGLGHTIDHLTINRPSTNYQGLFGYVSYGVIGNVRLTNVSVTGSSYVGGLVGYGTGNNMKNGSVSGSVSGSSYVGGLIGFSASGTIKDSSSGATVTAGQGYAGGLAGQNEGTVSNCSATGPVTGGAIGFVGGLIGYHAGTSVAVSNCYATGSVNCSGGAYAGGLVGQNKGPVGTSYATGPVSGFSGVGGLIGSNSGGSATVNNCYAAGPVGGTLNVGGLVGVTGNVASNSFWDTDTSGQPTSAGGTGKTTAEMQSLVTFTGAGWDIDATGGTGTTWRVYEGHTYPLLRSCLTGITATANDDSKTYDGNPYSGGNGLVLSDPAVMSALSGTLVFSGSSQGAVDAGSYVITPDCWSDQQGYDIAYADGTLVVNKATSTTTAASSPNPSTVGQTVTVSAMVTGDGAAPTGTVDFTDGTTTLCSSVTVTGGLATCDVGSFSAGSHTVTATYSGDADYTGSSDVVVQTAYIATTTTVTSSANPSHFGDTVTFTATVTDGATGTVDFTDGTTTLCSPVALTGGQATCDAYSLGVGFHTINATYNGDSLHTGSTGAVSQAVYNASVTTVASSANPSNFGDPVTFTATVTSGATGTVGFVSDGTTTLCSSVTLSGGMAACSTSSLGAGPHTITATYGGDALYSGSTGTISQAVLNSSATTVTSSVNPSVYGQWVTFTATVTSGATGTVIFTEGTTTLCSAALSGNTATCNTYSVAGGDRTITATYGGDLYYSGSSGAMVQTVNPYGSTTSVTSSANPSGFGDSVTFTATVSSGATGTVDFTEGANTLCSAVTITGDTALCSVSSLGAGSHTITAAYGGDSNFNGSSGQMTQSVSKNASTTTVTSSVNPSAFGQTVTFTATVTSGATGTVDFTEGATTLCSSVALSGGQATCDVSSPAIGSHTITATYSGDGNLNGSSGSMTQTVSAACLLSVTKTGAGSGTVTADLTGVEGDGIVCGADCSETYASGTTITLTPTADTGSVFSGWSGDCNGSGQVSVSATSACTATFAVVFGDLTVDGNVDVADALKALRIAAGIDAAAAADLARGDVAPLVSGTPAPDEVINTGDVVVILRKAVGLVSW